jgi:hypothetical protein
MPRVAFPVRSSLFFATEFTMAASAQTATPSPPMPAERDQQSSPALREVERIDAAEERWFHTGGHAVATAIGLGSIAGALAGSDVAILGAVVGLVGVLLPPLSRRVR